MMAKYITKGNSSTYYIIVKSKAINVIGYNKGNKLFLNHSCPLSSTRGDIKMEA